MYGPVSVDTWGGLNLPYADNLVNLIVAQTREDLSDTELFRVLAPGGCGAGSKTRAVASRVQGPA